MGDLLEFDSVDLIRIIVTSVVSIIVMYLLTKLMGEKQIHQLNMFDYMTGITVGSIAAELATDLENPIQPLIAMLIYGLAAYLVSFVTMKSIKLRKLINGQSVVLMDKGKLYRANLAAAHIELSEFIAMCREQGFFDLSQIETAILEHTGTLSVLLKSEYRPYTPADANLKPALERPKINVIMDGKVMRGKLQLAGVDERWLNSELKSKGGFKPSEVALACVDENKALQIYPMIRERNKIEWFE